MTYPCHWSDLFCKNFSSKNFSLPLIPPPPSPKRDGGQLTFGLSSTSCLYLCNRVLRRQILAWFCLHVERKCAKINKARSIPLDTQSHPYTTLFQIQHHSSLFTFMCWSRVFQQLLQMKLSLHRAVQCSLSIHINQSGNHFDYSLSKRLFGTTKIRMVKMGPKKCLFEPHQIAGQHLAQSF